MRPLGDRVCVDHGTLPAGTTVESALRRIALRPDAAFVAVEPTGRSSSLIDLQCLLGALISPPLAGHARTPCQPAPIAPLA